MAWFVFARLLFVGAVGYSAYQLQPLGGDESSVATLANPGFGVMLGALVVAFEIRHMLIAMTHILVIQQFVLKELQFVADSSDSMKRNRGRRGLDILQKIQKMSGVDVMISDVDFPEVKEVDLKLIELARTLEGKIVTNDFNLNKVAQLRGVAVLNINELANSLKPVVLPGEVMKVFILKEGKEYNQGVAYLDDGTMVVVDNARRMISKYFDIVVTRVLQTTAGKMIFGRYIEAPAQGPVAAVTTAPAASGGATAR